MFALPNADDVQITTVLEDHERAKGYTHKVVHVHETHSSLVWLADSFDDAWTAMMSYLENGV